MPQGSRDRTLNYSVHGKKGSFSEAHTPVSNRWPGGIPNRTANFTFENKSVYHDWFCTALADTCMKMRVM